MSDASAVSAASADSAVSTASSVAPTPTEPLDVSPCYKCGVMVFVGPERELPAGTELAYPKGTDWAANVGCEPFCQDCWSLEEEMLNKLSEQHKGVGPNKKKGVKKPKVHRTKKKQKAKKTIRKKHTSASGAE